MNDTTMSPRPLHRNLALPNQFVNCKAFQIAYENRNLTIDAHEVRTLAIQLKGLDPEVATVVVDAEQLYVDAPQGNLRMRLAGRQEAMQVGNFLNAFGFQVLFRL